MPKVSTRRMGSTSVELRSLKGKSEPNHHYVLVKTRHSGNDFYTAFVETELKGACLNILGWDDTHKVRGEYGPHRLAKQAWASSDKE